MNTFDFKVVTYNDTDHLTWSSMGHFGHYFSDMDGSPDRAAFIADSSYNIQKKVVIEKGASLDSLDIHEFTIVDGGKSAIMTTEKVQQRDVSSVTSKYHDGFNTLNKGFREIDLGTGRTKFEWAALDYGVTVDESFYLWDLNDAGGVWDYL
jgi:hypothetical protein